MDLGFKSVSAITVICYLVAEIVKYTRLNNKWVPVICGTAGALLGIVGKLLMPSFPADDFINAVAIGIASGFAATGVHETIKQINYKDQ